MTAKMTAIGAGRRGRRRLRADV